MPKFSKTQVRRVERQLQALYDSLSDRDKPVLEAVLSRAAEEPEVQGHMQLLGEVGIDVGDVGSVAKPGQKMTIKFSPEYTRMQTSRTD